MSRSGARRGRLAMGIAVLSVAATGCTGPGRPAARPNSIAESTTLTTETPPIAAPPPTTTTEAPLPVQAAHWVPCGALECAAVSVPLDYAHPRTRQLAIAVARHRATDPSARIGSLVINPGGPGGSGIDDLPTELGVLTGDLLARFDIVSFDPRGVSRSAPVRCHDGPQLAPPPATGPGLDPVPQDEASQRALLEDNRAYGAACAKASGDLLGHVGTVDVARDLDRVREAIGDDRLTFFGHSYGTLLGATYAELFPTRVRAMVLDGAIDPALSTQEMSLDQARGFDARLNDFFTWCRSSPGECAWRPGDDPTAAFSGLLATARSSALPAGGDHRAGAAEVYVGTLSTLYARSFWPSLGRALGALQRGDGSAMWALADGYRGHGQTNTADANAAITCMDHPVSPDLSSYSVAAAAAAMVAPVYGPVFAWGALECAAWPATPTRAPHTINAPEAPPILVVGTTGDPATPYAWAQALSSQLSRGVLVTRQGIDHVAYYYSSCVRAIDATYLIRLVTPTETRCAS